MVEGMSGMVEEGAETQVAAIPLLDLGEEGQVAIPETEDMGKVIRQGVMEAVVLGGVAGMLGEEELVFMVRVQAGLAAAVAALREEVVLVEKTVLA